MKDIKITFESTVNLLPLIGDQLLQTVDYVVQRNMYAKPLR